MKNRNKLKIIISAIVLTSIFTGCGATSTDTSTTEINSNTSEIISSVGLSIKDREGNDFVVMENVNKIISLAPSTTQILMDLGLEDKLVAVDTYSQPMLVTNTGLPEFDIMNPDAENLANLEADIIFATGMSMAKGDDPLKLLRDMGAVVTYIPTSKSIAEIKEDIMFIAEATGTKEQGQKLIDDMEEEINKYSEIGQTITDKKSVYFEIAAAPGMYSFGKEVFLNEMIELIGARNVLDDQIGWLPVEPESIVSANPDVILTNVNYIDNPVDEIKSRAGFSDVNAVKNNNVYSIDNNASTLANHNIVEAIKEIAEAVYPEVYNNK